MHYLLLCAISLRDEALNSMLALQPHILDNNSDNRIGQMRVRQLQAPTACVGWQEEREGGLGGGGGGEQATPKKGVGGKIV